jgi:hypothetical protein
MLQDLGQSEPDGNNPYLLQFYAIEPSAVLAITVEAVNSWLMPIRHRLELHAYYRGQMQSQDWMHFGPEREVQFNHFESAVINRDNDTVEVKVTWEEMKGELKSHTFAFDEPAQEMNII